VLAEMRWDDPASANRRTATFWMIHRDDLAKKRFDRVKHDVEIFE
jgi:hypothetical protein